MKQRLALFAALTGAALVLYALFSSQSDDEQVLENLARLEQALRFDAPPNLLQRTAHLNGEFKKLLTAGARVEVPERGLSATGRREIAGLAASATASLQAFHVSFGDITVEVQGELAKVQTLVAVEAVAGAEPRRSQRRATMDFTKVDGDWLLASAKLQRATDD